MPSRIEFLKPILDAIVEDQTEAPDAVYLSVPPQVTELPSWLQHYNETTSRPDVLRVLHMRQDYGPASKLLAALAEGGESGSSTLIIYGDDDMLYSPQIVARHLRAQQRAKAPTAFATRRISIGGDDGKSEREELVEGVGSISLVASSVPQEIFKVLESPLECKLSDDYWISRYLTKAGVKLGLLEDCQYSFDIGAWPRQCGEPFQALELIRHRGALSETVISDKGDGKEVAKRSGGDWIAQIERYKKCRDTLQAAEI